MKKNHKKLWKVLTIVFAAILVFCIVADVVTNYFFTSVNAFLLADTYKIVDDGVAATPIISPTNGRATTNGSPIMKKTCAPAPKPKALCFSKTKTPPCPWATARR